MAMILYLAVIESPRDLYTFRQIYEAYYPRMLTVALGILQNRRDAEDAVHEAFVKLIDNLEKISAPVCPQTEGYVVTIVENTAIDLYRRKRRRASVPLDEAYIGEQADPVNEAAAVSGVDAAIAALPELYREPLLLKYDMGYSTEEIARLLAVKPETIKKRIQRAKAQLEALLKEVEE